MAELRRALDPWVADDLAEAAVDPGRTVCLPAPLAGEVARAAAALANTRGGELLLGVETAPDGLLQSARGLPADEAEAALAEGLALVDPPLGHLVQTRTLAAPNGVVLVARVRVSPSTPHLVTDTGETPRLDALTPRPVRTRRELDDLYARGRGERERADRLLDAMIEKLVLAHYAFFNVAIIACTHQPSAEPFNAAATDALAPASDPFVQAFGLHGLEPKVWPGELELRTEGETGAYLRVTRGGAVAVGEVQRRPYHEEIDTLAGLRSRIEAMAGSACRLLAQASESVIVPLLFLEGVRGLRLVTADKPKVTTGQAPQDTARYALALGDAKDDGYPARLAEEALTRLADFFPPR